MAWKAESKQPSPVNSQRACPTPVSHTLSFRRLYLPIKQDLRLRRKIQLFFPPSPLLLSLASRCSKAKEIPESTSSEQEHRLKFSLRFCLCQHCALILGNIRDYRETESSTSVGRLKNMNGSLQNGPFFLQTCISKLNLSHFFPTCHCKQGTYCSKKFTGFLQIFPKWSLMLSLSVVGVIQGRASRLAHSTLCWTAPATAAAKITGNFGSETGNWQ